MNKYFCFVVSLTAIQIQAIYPQVLNRQPLVNIINRSGPEAIIEGRRNYIPQPYIPQIIENPLPNIPPFISPLSTVPRLPPLNPVPQVTTIVSDCSPSVCKNLAHTIQLMIVCNLLQNTQGGADLAAQFAAPIIREAISSPNLSCGCANPVSSSRLTTIPPILPPSPTALPASTIIPPNTYSNLITPNVFNYLNSPLANPNGYVFNML